MSLFHKHSWEILSEKEGIHKFFLGEEAVVLFQKLKCRTCGKEKKDMKVFYFYC